MKVVPTNATVADYVEGMQRNSIIVNKDYQRSNKVWPPSARSYLIESILLNYPVPKLSLYQKTDLKTKKTFKEIVDGQQRSSAIRDFLEDKLRLSRSLETEEIAGKRFSELPDEFKQRFVEASLSVDQFVAATDEEIREAFRRMNSYTIPLNPEERRHAEFQGAFKWFVHQLAKRFDSSFVIMGLFGERQLVRMTDMKLIAELCHAFEYGIRTTKGLDLNRLYGAKEKEFPEEDEWGRKLSGAFDQLIAWPDIHKTRLMRAHMIYSLALALVHMRHGVDALEGLFPSAAVEGFDEETTLANLGELAEALENPDAAPVFEEFVSASSSKTNVDKQRQKRFKWFCQALSGERF